MNPKNKNIFIEPKELIKKINDDPNFRYKILDATFYLPNSGLDAEQEFNGEHIKNSVFFDINKIAASDNSLPHMIPSKNEFSSKTRFLGHFFGEISHKSGSYGPHVPFWFSAKSDF